jgi:hypothetical protein
VLIAGAKRFLVLLAGIVVATSLVSLLLGLGLGARASRSLAVGFYLTGCALLLGGFFAANRGAFRVANEEGIVGLRRPRGVRVASGEEQAETFNLTGLLAVAGILVIGLGVAIDSEAELV